MQESKIRSREIYGTIPAYTNDKWKPKQQSWTYPYRVNPSVQAKALRCEVPSDGNWGRNGFAATTFAPIRDGFGDYAAPAAVPLKSNYVPLRGVPQAPFYGVSTRSAFSPYLSTE